MSIEVSQYNIGGKINKVALYVLVNTIFIIVMNWHVNDKCKCCTLYFALYYTIRITFSCFWLNFYEIQLFLLKTSECK